MCCGGGQSGGGRHGIIVRCRVVLICNHPAVGRTRLAPQGVFVVFPPFVKSSRKMGHPAATCPGLIGGALVDREAGVSEARGWVFSDLGGLETAEIAQSTQARFVSIYLKIAEIDE